MRAGLPERVAYYARGVWPVFVGVVVVVTLIMIADRIGSNATPYLVPALVLVYVMSTMMYPRRHGHSSRVPRS